MRVTVELWAFQDGIERVVEIPDERAEAAYDAALLNLVYHYGQNDVQPVADRCSVSMGDVIVLPDGSRWSVGFVGFEPDDGSAEREGKRAAARREGG